MIFDATLLIAGLTSLALGAEGIVRGSVSLSIRLGLTPLIIGLTVVAFCTSMPEMAVSLAASFNHQADIAVGNVVGSNIFNIGVILGISAMICPIKINLQVIKIDLPVMLLTAFVFLFFSAMGTVSRSAGILLLSALVAYVSFNVWIARKANRPMVEFEFQKVVPGVTSSVMLDVVYIGAGLLMLILGARLLVLSATDIAQMIGISEAVIALTVIAAGTSLPELATSLVAALRRQPDIAVGNVVGSNIFNILGIIGAASIVNPLSTDGMTPIDLWAMVVFSACLFPLVYSGLKLHRWKGGILIVMYGIYMFLLWS